MRHKTTRFLTGAAVVIVLELGLPAHLFRQQDPREWPYNYCCFGVQVSELQAAHLYTFMPEVQCKEAWNYGHDTHHVNGMRIERSARLVA